MGTWDHLALIGYCGSWAFLFWCGVSLVTCLPGVIPAAVSTASLLLLSPFVPSNRRGSFSPLHSITGDQRHLSRGDLVSRLPLQDVATVTFRRLESFFNSITVSEISWVVFQSIFVIMAFLRLTNKALTSFIAFTFFFKYWVKAFKGFSFGMVGDYCHTHYGIYVGNVLWVSLCKWL